MQIDRKKLYKLCDELDIKTRIPPQNNAVEHPKLDYMNERNSTIKLIKSYDEDGRIMIGEYESLEKVLRTIEVKEGLNKDNIIEEIKTELEKQDQGLYQEWKKVDIEGWTPLHVAALHGRANIVGVLLEKGANVNAVDRYGKTPLDYAEGYAKNQDVVKALLDARGGSFVKARNKAMIAGGVNTLLGTAIAVALFTTGTITAQLIPIVIAVVAVTAAALVVGCATYELLKPSTKVDGAEKPIVNSINEQQGVTSISSY
nr:unnamed protein product [Callosobruchus chinensis]